MSEPSCGNCRYFYLENEQCRRHAPPAYDYLRFYELELLRSIAWSLHTIAKLELPDPRDDLRTEATEALDAANWPVVGNSEWCGEFEPREAAA